MRIPRKLKHNISPSLRKLLVLMRLMTQAQKRDFRKYIKFWGNRSDRKYLVLYDLLSKFIAAGKDENQLLPFLLQPKKPHKTTDFISSSTYLYRKILESMRTTPDSSPSQNMLMGTMQDIAFLHSKQLFEDGTDIATTAYQHALSIDKPAYAFEINLWIRKLEQSKAANNTPTGIATWLEKQRHLLNEMETMLTFEALADELKFHLGKKAPLPEHIEEKIKSILHDPESVERTLSVRSRIWVYLTLSHYFDLQYLIGPGKTESGLLKKTHAEKSLIFQGKAIRIFEENKSMEMEEQDLYVKILGDYINRCLRFDRAELVEQLEKAFTDRKNEVFKYRYVAFYRLQYYLRFNDFKNAEIYFKQHDIAAGINKFKAEIPENRLLSLYFTIGQIYYAQNNFDQAGDWFSKVARFRLELKPDAVVVCKILEIICLWELKTFENDPNPTRPSNNLRRAFRRAKILSPFVNKILDAIDIVFKNRDSLKRSDLPDLLAEIKSDFENDKSKQLYYLILVWFGAKLHRTNVGIEIVKYQ